MFRMRKPPYINKNLHFFKPKKRKKKKKVKKEIMRIP